MTDFEQMWNQAAATREERKRNNPLSFYGKLSIEGRPVVLQAGVPGGKRDYDPDTDPEDMRRTGVRITVQPVSERATRDFEREFIAESREGDMFMDSMTSLGVTLAALRAGPYVRVDVVEDRRLGSYQDRTTGQERVRSGPVLREVFPDADACKASSDARYGGGNRGQWGDLAGNPSTPPPAPREAAGASAPSGGGIDRKTAAKFFPGLWTTSGYDPAKFLAALPQNKIMQKWFVPPLEAPEVLEFLTKMGHPEYEEAAAEAGAPGARKADGGDDNPVKLDEVPF